MEYKKLFAILGTVVGIIVLPVFLISGPMMGCYQSKIDENPNSESSKDWQFTLAKWCGSTGRQELAVDMYKKYIDRYKKDEKRPEAMFRRATCLRECERITEAKDQWRELVKAYPKDQFGIDADDLLRKQFNDYKR